MQHAMARARVGGTRYLRLDPSLRERHLGCHGAPIRKMQSRRGTPKSKIRKLRRSVQLRHKNRTQSAKGTENSPSLLPKYRPSMSLVVRGTTQARSRSGLRWTCRVNGPGHPLPDPVHWAVRRKIQSL